MNATTSARSVTRGGVVVRGSRQLLVEAVGRVLHERGLAVRSEDEAASARVLVEPDDADWIEATEARRATVVVTAAPLGAQHVLDLVVRGADGLVSLDSSPADLVDAVRSVAEGRRGLTLEQQRTLAVGVRDAVRGPPAADVALTARERDILDAIRRGVSVKHAARQLGISPKTVENTRRVLYRKLAARNRSQAMARAFELGLLDED